MQCCRNMFIASITNMHGWNAVILVTRETKCILIKNKIIEDSSASCVDCGNSLLTYEREASYNCSKLVISLEFGSMLQSPLLPRLLYFIWPGCESAFEVVTSYNQHAINRKLAGEKLRFVGVLSCWLGRTCKLSPITKYVCMLDKDHIAPHSRDSAFSSHLSW